MLLPDCMVFDRFRSFAGRAELPLRRITLVFGSNNAGKSALLRAVALLGASCSTRSTAALNLPPAAFPGVAHHDLAWRGERGRYGWTLGLSWTDGPVRQVLARIESSPEWQPYIDRLILQLDDSEWVARSNERRLLVDRKTGSELSFRGLVPVGEPSLLRDRLVDLGDRVSWLSGVRARTKRVVEHGARGLEPWSDGAGADRELVLDPSLLDAVNGFFARLRPARHLICQEIPGAGHALLLEATKQSGWGVHLLDTGEGMVQVLAVLVRAHILARNGGILAVEEPESHLHADAQRALAEHLCGLVAGAPHARLVLETHSRVFLLGVQVAVATGVLRPEDVAVVWVDQEESGRSRTTVVELDARGRLGDGWPATALGEDLRLARDLLASGRAPS